MGNGMHLLTLGLISMLVLACGSTTAPTSQLADARSALGAAEAVGAHDNPTAALHFKLARDGIERAMAQMEEGEHESAARALERARADAQLAELLARYDEARNVADEAVARVNELEGGTP